MGYYNKIQYVLYLNYFIDLYVKSGIFVPKDESVLNMLIIVSDERLNYNSDKINMTVKNK